MTPPRGQVVPRGGPLAAASSYRTRNIGRRVTTRPLGSPSPVFRGHAKGGYLDRVLFGDYRFHLTIRASPAIASATEDSRAPPGCRGVG